MLAAKAHRCTHAWLADNTKDKKKSQIKAKQTEIKTEKGQTFT